MKKSKFFWGFYFFLFVASYNTFGQTIIGKTEGAEINRNGDYYEVIFKTVNNQFSSFYIKRGIEGKDGLSALKKYVFLLFKNQREDDFLLQFIDDSILLIYKEGKVQIVKWTGHYSEKRKHSKWFTYSDYKKLFNKKISPK